MILTFLTFIDLLIFFTLTGDYLSEFVQLCRRRESTDQLLGNLFKEEEDANKGMIFLLCVRKLINDVLAVLSLVCCMTQLSVLKMIFHIAEAAAALQRLTDTGPYTIPSLGNVVTKATTKLQIQSEEAPIALDLLNHILLVKRNDFANDSLITFQSFQKFNRQFDVA